jgi:TolB-like protein
MLLRPSLCEAEVNGQGQHLEPRVALVLVALARAEEAVLSRDDLITRCWDGVVVGDDAINRIIGKIRRLAESLSAGFYIETVPRVGYRLVRSTPRGPEAASFVPATRAAYGGGHEWTRLYPIPADPPPSAAPAGRVVAVLPFDGNGDAAAAQLAEGVSDCVQAMLARDTGAAVIGRPTSLQFRGARKSRAARTLGAGHLIDGTVSISGDEVRVTAFLIDGNHGVTLWSEQIRGSMTDPFAVQTLSAAKVTDALRRQFRKDVAPLRTIASPPALPT